MGQSPGTLTFWACHLQFSSVSSILLFEAFVFHFSFSSSIFSVHYSYWAYFSSFLLGFFLLFIWPSFSLFFFAGCSLFFFFWLGDGVLLQWEHCFLGVGHMEPWHELIRLDQYTWSIDSRFHCHLLLLWKLFHLSFANYIFKWAIPVVQWEIVIN